MTDIQFIRKILFILFLFLIVDFLLFSVFKKGIDLYYGMNKEAEVLLVGHSHTVLGLDSAQLERELHIPVAKYATAGANIQDRFWMLQQFVEEHPSVKIVVYDVDPRLFDSEGLSSASYTLFLPYLDDKVMSEYMKQEATWQEYYAGKLIRTTRFRDQTINIALRGLSGKIQNKKSGQFKAETVKHYLEREKNHSIRINPEAIQLFHDTIGYLTAKEIRVILTFIPVVDLLTKLDPVKTTQVTSIFQNIANNSKKVFFFNYNKDYQHDHSLFYDMRHLNIKGNGLVTERLAFDLKSILSE